MGVTRRVVQWVEQTGVGDSSFSSPRVAGAGHTGAAVLLAGQTCSPLPDARHGRVSTTLVLSRLR